MHMVMECRFVGVCTGWFMENSKAVYCAGPREGNNGKLKK
jgi:hypothetical protein